VGGQVNSGSAAAEVAEGRRPAVELVGDAARSRRLGAALAAHGLDVLRDASAPSAPDAVVLALAQADRVACDLVAALRRRTTGALVVVVPASDNAVVRRLLDAGVDAVVFESEARLNLPSAVRAACDGQLVLPRSYRDGFGRPALTRREKQVLGLVVMGLSNAEIARRLHLSQSTVKCHLTASFSKLGARSRSEATALILDPVRGFGLGVLALTPRPEPRDER
jgi:DNA-binding NarL/FixJ family response regulator